MNAPINLKNKTDEELAEWQANLQGSAKYEILAVNEWRRRETQEQNRLNAGIIEQQHKLNLIILGKQSRLWKISIVAAFVGVIIGAILTAWLPTILSVDKPKKPIATQEQTTRSTTEPLDIFHYKQDSKTTLKTEKPVAKTLNPPPDTRNNNGP